MLLIDTHAHLYYDSMYNDLKSVLSEAESNYVKKTICIGTDLDTSLKSIQIAEKNENVFATVGIHPHDSKDVPSDYLSKLEKLALNKKVVAIGEIGIDNYRNHSPNEIITKKYGELDHVKLINEIDSFISSFDRNANPSISVMNMIINSNKALN